MNKTIAIVLRDAFIDVSYPMPFIMRWVGILVGVSAFHFASQLVAPSRVLGAAGHKSTYFSYVVINIAFMMLQTNALSTFAGSLRRDQQWQVIEPIFATPTSVELVALAGGLWKIILSFMQMVFYLGTATLLFHLNLRDTNVATLLVFMALSVACMSSIGIIAAGVVIYAKQEPPSGLLVGGFASLLAGVWIPVALLPRPMQALSWLLPITHSLAGMRAAIAGASIAKVGGQALWLAVACAILTPAALFIFKLLVNRARTDGTLGHY